MAYQRSNKDRVRGTEEKRKASEGREKRHSNPDFVPKGEDLRKR